MLNARRDEKSYNIIQALKSRASERVGEVERKSTKLPTMEQKREDANVYRKAQVSFTKKQKWKDTLEYHIILYFESVGHNFGVCSVFTTMFETIRIFMQKRQWSIWK